MTITKNFLKDRRGNFATTFGMLAAAFSVAVAMAMQIAGLSHARSNLQEVVDAAVLAAAQEAQLANFSRDVAQGVAEDFVVSNLTGRMREPKVETLVESGSRLSATQFSRTEVTVKASAVVDHPLWSAGDNTVTMEAFATARIRSSGKMCVIVLEQEDEGALTLTTGAVMTAPDCAVYSNSTSAGGIVTYNHVRITSPLICTSGGFDGRLSDYSSAPLTDCPQAPNPLASRKPPAVGVCLAANTNVFIKDGFHTLKPGTYCGGVKIGGQSVVELAPGEYIFKDGPLIVGGSATLRGDYVGLYFTGENAIAEFGIASTIDIGAPKSGPMSGLLIFQDPANSEDDLFSIKSSNARNLLGTIYIPSGGLFIDAAGKIADESAYTTIVARTMKLMNGPNLVLNTDYDGTDVPVPTGVGPLKGEVWLAR